MNLPATRGGSMKAGAIAGPASARHPTLRHNAQAELVRNEPVGSSNLRVGSNPLSHSDRRFSPPNLVSVSCHNAETC